MLDVSRGKVTFFSAIGRSDDIDLLTLIRVIAGIGREFDRSFSGENNNSEILLIAAVLKIESSLAGIAVTQRAIIAPLDRIESKRVSRASFGKCNVARAT